MTKLRRVIIGVALLGIGCAWASQITAHDRMTTAVTWDREVGPIVQARCVSCHADRNDKTMSLATYEAARPWARAIRQQVLTRRMPIWHAARGYGEFRNDPSLSPLEIALIVAWVDGGAPKTVAAPVSKLVAASPLGLAAALTSEPHVTAAGRDVTVRCGGGAVPVGLLKGLRPQLDRGGSVRVTALLPDGRREILGWFRDFDPDYAPTYWLRTPLKLTTGTRLVTEVAAAQSCALVLRID